VEQTNSNDVTAVRLLVYSGRPDPEWELEDDRAKALLGQLTRVTGGERSNPAPQGGLGYRGFLVRNVKVAEARTADLTVFRGVVAEHPGTDGRAWRDTAGIEHWLLEEARRRGHGDLLEVLKVGLPGQ
jgi:hypothetical protein